MSRSEACGASEPIWAASEPVVAQVDLSGAQEQATASGGRESVTSAKRARSTSVEHELRRRREPEDREIVVGRRRGGRSRREREAERRRGAATDQAGTSEPRHCLGVYWWPKLGAIEALGDHAAGEAAVPPALGRAQDGRGVDPGAAGLTRSADELAGDRTYSRRGAVARAGTTHAQASRRRSSSRFRIPRARGRARQRAARRGDPCPVDRSNGRGGIEVTRPGEPPEA